MKTIAELRTEIAMGFIIWHATSAETYVCRSERNDMGTVIPQYMLCSPPGNPAEGWGYEKLDDLIADWPIASEPVWGTLEQKEKEPSR